ncbi:M23 family metallopeptidase [Algimonas porphyrae]|uniref:Peptidase M23 n=1 Tax=Algimonas porphyrae TaxID=1128113 RepID=A0ABQ5V0R3_9PROT|nr:M23 family metallopeptidase [Algimonas porphyrae]GLQ21101.1 peptidase M23 [Algimonas porphyrae]
MKNTLKSALAVRMQAFGQYSSTRVPAGNGIKALCVFGAVALVGLMALPTTDDGVDAVTIAEATALPVPTLDLARFDMALAEEFAAPELAVREVTLKPGDNLGPLLQREGMSGPDAHRFVQAFSEQFSPRRLRAGQSFNLHLSGDTITDVTFRPSAEQTVFVSRQGADWTSRAVNAEFRYEMMAVKASIANSLYVDATRLGAPDKVVAQFASIYEYSVDFQRDIQPGDEFELFFEVARDHKGDVVKAGDLLFTSFSPRGRTMDYWLFEDDNGFENYYDALGKTAKRKLRATPINGARLSSSFGSRKHPILGYRKMHSGVDFAAPRGTPILAAGSGVVERANRYGSFGNYIRIRHTDGYKTAYAHLQGFARGVKAGARVRQDQVIGYVGTTGRSTGPHLHYEVIHNGKKINPRKLSQLSGKPLSSDRMPEFESRRSEIEAMRASTFTVQPVTVPPVSLRVAQATETDMPVLAGQ